MSDLLNRIVESGIASKEQIDRSTIRRGVVTSVPSSGYPMVKLDGDDQAVAMQSAVDIQVGHRVATAIAGRKRFIMCNFTSPSGAGSSGVVGPQGPKGDTGSQGPQGPKGDKGDTGPQGSQGLQGAKGDIGAPGQIGVTGPTGAQGPKGDAGNQGPKGDAGNVGATGPTGATGATGPQGPKGDTGLQGPSGVNLPLPTGWFRMDLRSDGHLYAVVADPVSSGVPLHINIAGHLILEI